MESSSYRLEVKNINKTFPGVKALVDVDFNIREGEVVSLVGENGAGKSTLINVISGQIIPDSGEIFFGGKKAHLTNPTDAIALGVGLVPQELNLVPYLSVAENIFLGSRHLGGLKIDWNQMNTEARNVLETLDVEMDVTSTVENMSVAEQQMVQIARALRMGADILILDEPTACLTINETEKLLGIVRKLKESGKSIIFVSHHLDEVIEISDRVSVMRDGVHIETLPKEELTEARLIKGMVGREVQATEILRREVSGDDIILKVENLTREGEFHNISFEVKKGEIFGIAGLVGAGRTELVSTIFGERKASSGQVWFEGEPLVVKGPDASIKKGIGFVPEERRKFSILPTMCIRENVSIANLGKIFKFPVIRRNIEDDMVDKYCGQVHVKMASPEGLLTKLSGGNQQKVVIARWLAVGCRLLIIDEPTRGIDVVAKDEIHKLIRQCADEGMTVLVVSSEHQELINLCNRILIMHEGEQKGIVDASEVTQEAILSYALA